jgi:probable rRNA maturation factor
MIEVEICNTQNHLRIDMAEVNDLVCEVLRREGREDASISIALVDQASMHALNRTHLGHDWPTDVISFPLSNPDDPALSGELVVSAEMAASAAREVGARPEDELALYIVHGLLHLCGYDDHAEPDSAAMRRREDEILTALGFAQPVRPSPGEGEGFEPDSGSRALDPGLPGSHVSENPRSRIPEPKLEEESDPWSA